MRLHQKAVLAIVSLLVATTLVMALGAVRFMGKSVRQEVGFRGQAMADQLALAAEYPVFVGDGQGLQELIDRNRGQPDVAYLRFEDASGRLLAEWGAGAGALAERFAAPVRLAVAQGRTAGVEGSAASPAGSVIGRVVVGMGYARSREEIARIRRAMAWTALPVALAGVLLTIVLVRRAVSPLEELARGLGQVAEGRPAGEIKVRGRDEVARLTSAFNRMLRDLKAYRDEVERVHNNLEARVRRRTHELEVANRELVAASRTKSEFLANVSHELRTPLNAILGFLGLVIDGHASDPREIKELLGDAQKGARHLLAVINSILDLAKIETGKMSVQREEVILQQVFDEVASLMRGQAEAKGVDLGFEALDPPSVSVAADAVKLKQVLVNLLGNSLKFTPEGFVRVRAQASDERGHVRFDVQDTGMGIPPDKHHLLFRQFQQIDPSHTRRYGGTGLGLAICRALVEMMGGRIWVTSEGEGKGTTVSFTLPLYRGQEAPRESAEVRGAGPIALVVEDDPVCRQVLCEILTLGGYRVAQAAQADEAIEKARQIRPVLVTVDLALPAPASSLLGDGCDLIRALMSDPVTRSAEVALISGQEPHLVRERLEREELPRPVRVFGKPIDTHQLLAWVEELRAGILAPA
jgi:signal transduction histidine kinase